MKNIKITMRNYTKIPNEMLSQSQLTIQARYLYCVLLKHCGKDDKCFPSQKLLAETIGFSDRHTRNYLNELIKEGIVAKKRRGWNRTNTYFVSKYLESDRKGNSYHLRSILPVPQGNTIPPKSTYLKGKGKRSLKDLERMRKTLMERKIIK